MKTARQPDRRAKESRKRCWESADTDGVRKSRKRVSQEMKVLDHACIKDDLKNVQNFVKPTNPTKMTERSDLLDLYPTQTLHPRTKMKLQLFPINEKIRMALEKDGYHPHLELTLRAGKKISSVLSHLLSKWGRSSVARGELMLFPFSKPVSLASGLRWTLNDRDISAGDIHAAVGGSSIFRLRYGWVSTPLPFELHPSSEGMGKGCGSTVQVMHGEGKQSEEMADEIKSSNMNDVNNTAASEKMVEFPTNGMDTEPPLDSGLELSSKSGMLQLDSISNISIGGLLSEASLFGTGSSWDSKIKSNAGVHPAQVVTDSLDACIAAAKISYSQAPKQPQNDQHSSILDAEETCDAFRMKRFSSSSKDILSLDASSGGTVQDAGSKLFKCPKTSQVPSRSELPQDLAGKEFKSDLMFCSRVFHDERSLGLSGIKWSDSLGPFDLGLPVSRKVSSSGDGISMSGFVR